MGRIARGWAVLFYARCVNYCFEACSVQLRKWFEVSCPFSLGADSRSPISLHKHAHVNHQRLVHFGGTIGASYLKTKPVGVTPFFLQFTSNENPAAGKNNPVFSCCINCIFKSCLGSHWLGSLSPAGGPIQGEERMRKWGCGGEQFSSRKSGSYMQGGMCADFMEGFME